MDYKKTVEATDDLIGNKIAIKSTEVSKNSQQDNSEKLTNKYDQEIPKEIPKERYISPEKREKIIDNLRLI